MSQRRDGAVLVDLENIAISVHNAYGTSPDLERIAEAAASHCRPVVRRAYGEWSRSPLNGELAAVRRANIEPVFSWGKLQDGTVKANAADVRLSIDAIDLMWTRPGIEVFVLVSGDRDLLPVATYLREHGREVVVVGVSATLSASLCANADAVVRYEEIVECARIETCPRELRVQDLPEPQRQAFLDAIRELESQSAYMTFKFLQGHLERRQVLPLGQAQIAALLNDALASGLLVRTPAQGTTADGEEYTYSKISLRTETEAKTGEPAGASAKLNYRPFAQLAEKIRAIAS